MSGVGAILKSARETKGISLEEVANATSIRLRYLAAIENESFDEVPGEVYVKGFIRNYATYVGLNGPELVELYKEQLARTEVPDIPEEKSAQDLPASNPKEKLVVRGNNTKRTEPYLALLALVLRKKIILAVLGGMLLLAVFLLVWPLGTTPPENVSQQAASTAQQPQNSAAQAAEPPAKVERQPDGSYKVSGSGKITVTANFSQDCWTEVTTDGKEPVVGMLQQGQTRTWNADGRMELLLGNIRAVEVLCNDVKIPYSETENGVIVRVFTK